MQAGHLIAVALMIVVILLYVVVGAWLGLTGRPVRAGLAMIAIALLPLVWQVTFTDSDAPGFGVLLLYMLPVPLVLIAVGILSRISRRIFNRARANAGGAIR
jgi:hypothetical protein